MKARTQQLVRHLLVACALVLLAGTLLACAKAGNAGSSSSWRPRGGANDLSSMAFLNARRGIAVGAGHTAFLETTDGGRTWTSAQGRISPDRHVRSLPTRLGGLTLPAEVLSGGQAMFATTYSRPPGSVAVAAAGPSLVLRSDDGGVSWRVVLALAPADSVIDLAASDARHLWALCAPGKPDAPGSTYLMRSSDGGQDWQRLAGHGVFTAGGVGIQTPLLFTDAHHGWSLYTRLENAAWSNLRRTTDGGAAWRKSPPQRLGVYRCLAATGASTVWVGGDGRTAAGKAGGLLMASRDGGRTWQAAVGFQGASVSAVTFVGASDGWLVTVGSQGGGAIYATRDGGRTWRLELSSTSNEEWGDQWMFMRAGRELLASNGSLLYARALPSAVP
jgi:photosystem II stability/assembly factor-like uncharacterized protein